jgi:hypothetical protein
VELAAIGRRVCETEWDLLSLLQPDAALAASGRRVRTVPADDPSLHGRPTAIELVEAVREFLVDRVVTAELGATSYHARVAANALAIVERELAAGPDPLERRGRALGRLGIRDEADLCQQLRVGQVDLAGGEVIDVIADGVVERLSIANPGFLEASDR